MLLGKHAFKSGSCKRSPLKYCVNLLPECQSCSVMETAMDSRIRFSLILLTWKIWWAPNTDSKWQMGFNSAFKGLKPWISWQSWGIAQSTQLLATGWTVRGANPGGGKETSSFFIPFQTGPGTYPAPYSMGLLDPEDNITLRNVGNQSTERNILEDMNHH